MNRLRAALFASVVAVTSTSLLSSAAHAGDASAAANGLQPGTVVPTFQLPVVNDFVPAVAPTGPLAPKQVKWGPGRWTGERPDEQKKLVVMSFFATYCEPCKKEMPELARLYATYKDQGLGVMLVSIDKGDEQRQQIIDLAKANNVAFPVMHDRFQVVARRYAAERLPYMLLVDSTGTVVDVHVGYTEELKARLEGDVRARLGLAPLPPPAPTTPTKTTATKKPAKKAG